MSQGVPVQVTPEGTCVNMIHMLPNSIVEQDKVNAHLNPVTDKTVTCIIVVLLCCSFTFSLFKLPNSL